MGIRSRLTPKKKSAEIARNRLRIIIAQERSRRPIQDYKCDYEVLLALMGIRGPSMPDPTYERK